ncbi:MAG: glycosyltransferase family 39 protein [Planctomycetota bacterium]|nr:glycosyltransferase family 39 protein [Planctomycetota bacterium]
MKNLSQAASRVPPASESTDLVTDSIRPWNEALWFAVVFGMIVFIQFRVTGAGNLFSRWFWHDEIVTYQLVVDPNLAHSLRAIAAGADGAPPGYHLLLRAWSAVAGTSEISFRSFSFACMLLAAAGVYANLRRVFPKLNSLLGALVVWAHPTVLEQALQARFYAPWCAALAWFVFFLARTRSGKFNWINAAGLAFLSMLICLTHYFGVISLACVVVTHLLVHRGFWRDWRVYAGISVGPVALAASIPFFLLPQRAMSAVSSWAPAASSDEVLSLLQSVMNGRLLFVLAVVAGFGLSVHILQRWVKQSRSTDPPEPPDNWCSLAPLAGTLMLVPCLILMSYTIQPCLVPRYSLPAVLGLAPLVACLLSRIGPAWQVVGIAAVFVSSVNALHLLEGTHRLEQEDRLELVRALKQVPQVQPILFEFNQDCYVIEHYVPEVAGRCYLPDAVVGPKMSQYRRWQVFQADHTRVFSAFYDNPKLLQRKQMQQMQELAVVIDWTTNVDRQRLAPRYKQFEVSALFNRVYKLKRVSTLPKLSRQADNRRNARATGGGG